MSISNHREWIPSDLNENDLYIVVRSSGERTAPMTTGTLQRSFPTSRLDVIAEAPLQRSLNTSLERAVEQDARWMLIVDADVILQTRRLRAGLDLARSMPSEYFVMTFAVDDWLFGGKRVLGVRLYRVAYAPQAQCTLNRGQSHERPESSMIRAMSRQGYKSAGVLELVGIHDRHQWMIDYYRKGYFFGHKHLDKLERLVSRWRRLSVEYPEFCAAMLGLADGLLAESPGANIESFDVEHIRARLTEHGLSEVAPLTSAHEAELAGLSAEAMVGPAPRRWRTDPIPSDLHGLWRESRRWCGRWEALSELRDYYARAGYRSVLHGLKRSRSRPADISAIEAT